MGFVNEKDKNGNWRTIDKDKNIVLIKTKGPHPGSGYEFELTYKEKKMLIRGKNKGGVNQSLFPEVRKIDMKWEFYEMYIPDDLRGEQEDIQKVITEALEIRGYLFDEAQTNSVTVKFSLRN